MHQRKAEMDGRPRQNPGYILQPQLQSPRIQKVTNDMLALIAVLLILALLFGFGFTAHALWIVFVVVLLLALVAFFTGRFRY